MLERILLALLVGVAILLAGTTLASWVSDTFENTADRVECANERADVCVLDDVPEQ